MVTFRLPIDDWSDDGHGKCEYFVVETEALDIVSVREDFFNISKQLGEPVEKFMFTKYQDYEMSMEQRNKILEKFHIDPFRDLVPGDRDIPDDELPDFVEFDPEMVATLIVFLLGKVSGLAYVLTVEEYLPILPFYGSDDQGRHIGRIGYGMFV